MPVGMLLVGLLAPSCSDSKIATGDAGDGVDGNTTKRYSKSFTTSDDFAGGIESGVNHTAQTDQLQMNMGRAVFETPNIWIPNSAENTVTQIDTKSDTVIGTYPLTKDGGQCLNPSRTTVDLDNDVWIACRNSANVVKVSHDDGHVMLMVPLEGVPRGMAIDALGKIWIGCGDCDPGPTDATTVPNCTGTNPDTNDLDPVYKLDEKTGACLMGNKPGCQKPPLMVADWPYGAAVDQRGFLWMLSNHHWTSGTLTKIDTTTDTIVGVYKRTPIPGSPNPNDLTACSIFYGIAIDQLGFVWAGNWTCGDLLKFNGETGAFVGGYLSGKDTRGVAVDLDGNIWVANSQTNTISKHSGATGELLKTLNVGTAPIGVGVDAYGHVWAVNQGSNNVYKINGITFDATIIPVGQGPYTYSDMLGTALRTITLRRGNTAYWTDNYDTGTPHPFWQEVRWTAEEPNGSKIRVRTRCASDKAGLYGAAWSPYLDAPGPIVCDPERWIQVEVQFTASSLTDTPILKDLTLFWES